MDYNGIKALVMGLGLHGGGLETARFLLKRGADVTITDLRGEETLMPSINELEKTGGKPARYILGRHDIEDFKKADIVIKNPGVRPDSEFLQAARHIETDLSLFLRHVSSTARIFAVTGTKGKSFTATALYAILSAERKTGAAYLGGNITVSPLTFLDEITKDDDVVLELSSFQLGDIKGRVDSYGSSLLKPKAAVITPIMRDHLDRYASMEEYVDDKKNIYRGQDSGDITIAGDDEWGKNFRDETRGRFLVCSNSPLGEGISGGWIDAGGRGFARLYDRDSAVNTGGETVCLVPENLKTRGYHQRYNMLSAALASYALGISEWTIQNALASFPGIEHRLELFHEIKSGRGGNAVIKFYNDTAATIPEAAAACVEVLSKESGLILVTGGTDKNLDFSPLVEAAKKTKGVILLAGTGSEKLKRLLTEAGVSFNGPFDNLDKAVIRAIELVKTSKRADSALSVALSPGCASFGMFQNEFDRGRKWKEAVLRLS